MASMPPAGTRWITISRQDVADVYARYGGIGYNPEVQQHSFDLLKAYAEGSLLGRFGAAAALANDFASRGKWSPTTKSLVNAGSFVVSEVQVTVALRLIAQSGSPARMGGAAGFALLQKTGMVQGLLPNDQHTAKCTLAMIELVGSAGLSLLTPIEGASGIGAPIAILTLMALISQARAAREACGGGETS